MPFTVIIAENSHYMDESESYTHGEFPVYEEALAAAQGIVDADLDEAFTPGMTAEDLYHQYTTFGRDAYIVPAAEASGFSAWDYAKERCSRICATPSPAPAPIDWFKVSFEETAVYLNVSPPGRAAWQDRIEWRRIVRICFKAGGFLESDELYIFTGERPESRLIPIDASGGFELWDEILRRGVFDAHLAIRAAQSLGGELFCDPEN